MKSLKKSIHEQNLSHELNDKLGNLVNIKEKQIKKQVFNERLMPFGCRSENLRQNLIEKVNINFYFIELT